MIQHDTSLFADKMQRLLYQLVKNYEQCDELCVAQYGVTASQAYTLMALPEKSQVKVSMNELSETMNVANSTMTRMVDHLVRKGLACRQSDYDDRRIVRVGLTAQGQQVRHAIEAEKHEIMQGILADIHEDDRSVVLRAVEKVTELFGRAVKSCCSR